MYPIDRKPDAQAFLNQLNRLVWDENVVKVRELLQLNLDHYRKQNDDAEGSDMLRNQGAVRFLVEFIDLIDDSKNILNKLRGIG